jgi:mannonate dehydratase
LSEAGHSAKGAKVNGNLDRRQFFQLSGAAAVTLGSAAIASTPAPPAARPQPGGAGLKLGCQSGPSSEQHFAFFARYGVRNICASPSIADPDRVYATVAELGALQDMAARHGLSVDMTDSVLLNSTLVDVEKHPAIMLAQSPQRDRDIESFQTLIRNCAQVGIPAIKYNMSILGVLRNTRGSGRGDAEYLGWDASLVAANLPLTRAGVVDADAAWERITYFLERVVPVANEYKIRIACHPQDPGVPPTGYRGVNRVLGTVDGLKRFVSIHESAYHGLNFCQGTVCENLPQPSEEIFDVIRYFGQRKKIFNVHFRNIKGRRDRFTEAFPDDGDIDMLRAVRTYREVGYEGMLMPDHVPLVAGSGTDAAYAYNLGGNSAVGDGHLESFAFAYGYLRGLIQSVQGAG